MHRAQCNSLRTIIIHPARPRPVSQRAGRIRVICTRERARARARARAGACGDFETLTMGKAPPEWPTRSTHRAGQSLDYSAADFSRCFSWFAAAAAAACYCSPPEPAQCNSSGVNRTMQSFKVKHNTDDNTPAIPCVYTLCAHFTKAASRRSSRRWRRPLSCKSNFLAAGPNSGAFKLPPQESSRHRSFVFTISYNYAPSPSSLATVELFTHVSGARPALFRVLIPSSGEFASCASSSLCIRSRAASGEAS